MYATALSCALRGLAGVPVTVEADIAAGLPGFTIVGLTDRAIQEARERVKAAIRNGGFQFPARKLTVNLAPAEVPKEGTAYDLAIALAVLRSAGHEIGLDGTALLGELSLDASLRPVNGVLPMARALRAQGGRRRGGPGCGPRGRRGGGGGAPPWGGGGGGGGRAGGPGPARRSGHHITPYRGRG